jgi:hypothetical protein
MPRGSRPPIAAREADIDEVRRHFADGPIAEFVHRVIVEGGLPRGSTPEKPEGDNYSDVPPEEPR